MAEAAYELIEQTGTPVLNGYGTKPGDADKRRERDVDLTLSFTAVTPILRSRRTLDWKELYPEEIGRSSLLIRAWTLLAQGQQSLRKARDCLIDEDTLNADYEITLFQGLIPELFCCKPIGEGFATIVVALRWALKNRRGDPLTLEQLDAVLNCVVRLNTELFLKYERALDLIDDLENAGLNTDISVAEPIAALLIDETSEPTSNEDNR
jgi:hypothetical protein